MLKPTSRQPSHREQLRREARRPIESSEVPHLECLGHLLKRLRKTAGMTQRDLACSAELSSWMVSQIELGTRRTRQSTLRRIARAIVGAVPNVSTEDELTEQLVEAAGAALAPESGYRDRVDRRRKRRAKRGRYGPREEAPLPGEELRAYRARLRRWQMLPKRGVCCPTCGQELRATYG